MNSHKNARLTAHGRYLLVQRIAQQGLKSAVALLRAAVSHYAALGVSTKRLIADNGSAYRSGLFAKTCQALGIKHTFTRPY